MTSLARGWRAVHTFHWSALGGGFSVDAGVRIEATDRTGLERLKQRGADLVYRCGKGHAESLPSSKYAGAADKAVPPAKPKPRPLAHYLWAALIAHLLSYLRGAQVADDGVAAEPPPGRGCV